MIEHDYLTQSVAPIRGVVEYGHSHGVHAQLERFNELVHIGWQASLPALNGQFVTPERVEGHSGVQLLPMLDAANVPYQDAPLEQKQVTTGIARKLVGFMVDFVVDSPRPIDERRYLLGRQQLFEGHMAGRCGNPEGGYDLTDFDDIERWTAWNVATNKSLSSTDVKRRLAVWPGADYKRLGFDEKPRIAVSTTKTAYSTVVPEKLGQAYETILDLGFLALRMPQVFPYPYYPHTLLEDQIPAAKRPLTYLDKDFIQMNEGIKEGAVRGMAAINYVVGITGKTTPLQDKILAHYQVNNPFINQLA